MGNGCCAMQQPRYKRTLSRIFQSYKSGKDEGQSEHEQNSDNSDPKTNPKRKEVRRKQLKASLAKLKRIEKFVETQGKRDLIFYLQNSTRDCKGVAGQLYATVVDPRTRLTHKLISISLFRQIMQHKFAISGERLFKTAADSYIMSIIDKFSESSKFSLKLASLKLLRDYIPLPMVAGKNIPNSLERVIRDELDQKQIDLQTVNFEILLNASRQMSNPCFYDLHFQMIKSVLHLLSNKIWPMEMWGAQGFFYGGAPTSRKRSESGRSSLQQVSGPPADVSQENVKSKRKVELLDIFFQVLNSVGHQIDNHIKDCKFFVDKLLKFFDANHWELKPLISHVLKQAVFYQPTEIVHTARSESMFNDHPDGEADVGFININILDQCLLGIRRILEEDIEWFHKEILAQTREVPNEFIQRHLTKVEIYYEVFSIQASNLTISTATAPFLKTEERKLISLLTTTFIMAALMEARIREPESKNSRRNLSTTGGSLLNRLNLKVKPLIMDNFEIDYAYLINFSKCLLMRVNDVNTAVDLASSALTTLSDTLPQLDKDIDSSFNLVLSYYEQYINILVRLISNDNYFLSDVQSVTILEPLLQLGLKYPQQHRLLKLIEKYLKSVEFRGNKSSVEKMLVCILYNYQLMESFIAQHSSLKLEIGSGFGSQKTLVSLFSSSISMFHHLFMQYQGSKYLPEILLALLNSLDQMRATLSLKLQTRILYAAVIALLLYNSHTYLKGSLDLRSYKEKEFLGKIKEIKEETLRKALFTFIKQFESDYQESGQKHSKDYLRIICDQCLDSHNLKTTAKPLFQEDIFESLIVKKKLAQLCERQDNNENKLGTISLHQIIAHTFQIQREITLKSVIEAYHDNHEDERKTGIRLTSVQLLNNIEVEEPAPVGQMTPQQTGRENQYCSQSVMSFTMISEETGRTFDKKIAEFLSGGTG